MPNLIDRLQQLRLKIESDIDPKLGDSILRLKLQMLSGRIRAFQGNRRSPSGFQPYYGKKKQSKNNKREQTTKEAGE